MKKPKVLFIFSGDNRANLKENVLYGKSPDSSFFGALHLSSQIDVVVIDFSKEWNKVGYLIRKWFGFNIAFLTLLWKIRKYDYIVLSNGLFLVSLGKFLNPYTKFLILNIDLTNVLHRINKKKIKKYILLDALKNAYRILCLSNDQINYLKGIGIDERKLIFIHFGVDIDFYKQCIHKPQKGHIVSIGRDLGRDYKTLIEAAENLPRLHFTIIAAPKNFEEIDTIPSNVKVLYNLSYKELIQIYTTAEFVLISSYKEDNYNGSDCSGQTAILDILASGIPVVASRRGWMKDYFIEGKHLVTYNPEDREDLIRTIKNISQNKSLMKSLKEEGKKIVQEELSSKKLGESISNIILDSENCRICESYELSVFTMYQDYIYKKCRRCNSIFLSKENDIEFSSLYGTEYFTQDYKYGSGSEFNYFENPEQKMKSYISQLVVVNSLLLPSQEKKILDVGCAAGYFLACAKREGYDAFGVELSLEASEFAQKEFNIPILAHDITQLNESWNNTFDVITLFQTLEHVPDPLAVLKKSYNLLKPGGYIYIEVPNLNTIDTFFNRSVYDRIFSPPYHVFVFTPHTLREVVTRSNFSVIHEQVYFSNIMSLLKRLVPKKNSVVTKHDLYQKKKIHIQSAQVLLMEPSVRRVLRKVLPGPNMRIIGQKPLID